MSTAAVDGLFPVIKQTQPQVHYSNGKHQANMLQSCIRSCKLNCLFALTELYPLSAIRGEGGGGGAAGAGAAAGVASQKCFSHHAELREGPSKCCCSVTVPSFQNKSMTSPCSEPQQHHWQEGKPRWARWRHATCVTDVCVLQSSVPLLQSCSWPWNVCVNGAVLFYHFCC